MAEKEEEAQEEEKDKEEEGVEEEGCAATTRINILYYLYNTYVPVCLLK